MTTTPSMLRTFWAVPLALLVMTNSGCDDPFGPIDWPGYAIVPDTVQLFSLARPELLGLPSAYDFTDRGRRRIAVEEPGATGNWDVALTERDGQLVLIPPGALPALGSSAGIMPVTGSFDALESAPTGAAAAYQDSTAVPLSEGQLYVVRSRRVSVGFISNCQYYAKVEALEVDATAGTLLFRYIANPNCNDPALVPPEND